MGRMTLLGAGAAVSGGGGGGSGFVALGSTNADPAAGTSITTACTGTLAAGAVAVVAIGVYGTSPTDFRDNVDAATAWTTFGAIGAGSDKLVLYKRIVPAGGFNTSTVFTTTMGGTGQYVRVLVGGFADATAIPTTNDNTAVQTNGGTLTATITGPTVGTSYQFAATEASAFQTSGPDSGSDPSWTLDRQLTNSVNHGLRTYWRKASGTGSTTLKETYTSTSVIILGYVEAAL